MRIDVEKHVLVGPMSIRDSFFETLQHHGIVEFPKEVGKREELTPDIKAYIDALNILRTMVPVEGIHPDELYRSGLVVAQAVVEGKGTLERLHEERRALDKEIARVHVFGHFSIEDLRTLEDDGHRKIQFFYKKSSNYIAATELPEVLYIGSAFELDYYIAINSDVTQYDGLHEMTIERSLTDLEERLAEVRKGIDEAEIELATLAHYKHILRKGLANALNHYHLVYAKGRVESRLDGGLFTCAGWVPKNKVALLHQLAEEAGVYVDRVALEKEDRVPTYLENKHVNRLGEDLIGIYDTPSIADRDPSSWVFWAFGLFFSMIINDAGYGLVILAISLFLLFKSGKKGGASRRVLMLSTSLAIGCIIWGVFTASFFGFELPPDSPLHKISFIDWMVREKADYVVANKGVAFKEWVKDFPAVAQAKTGGEFLDLASRKSQSGELVYVAYDKFNDNVMMELVLIIGTLHIMLSFLRNLDRNWSGVGWVCFLVGGYLYFPSVLRATSMIHYILGIPPVEGAAIGFWLLLIGMGVAWILAIIQKKMGGLAEIAHVVQVFADIMSYLRIYALALAGMIMAATFNKMGSEVPIYVGVFLILVGHTINFIMAIGSGLIHGLRLNFIEWYHYSFEGGGKPFNPLKLLTLD